MRLRFTLLALVASGLALALGCAGNPCEEGFEEDEEGRCIAPDLDNVSTTDSCPSGAVSEARFGELAFQKLCAEQETCNPGMLADMGCPDDPTGTGTGTANCVYHAAEAVDCLCASWECNTEFAGFEYVEQALVCANVFTCSSR